MELWQMDLVGGVLLEDGTECKVLTGVDDHSRFCVSAGIMVRATRPGCLRVLRRGPGAPRGAPRKSSPTTASVFTNRFGLRTSEVLFDKICRENGIAHRLTAPGSPTTTGKIERFHRTLRTEFLAGQLFASLELAQKALDAWVVDYNTERPHQSLGMTPPLQRFSRRAEPTVPVLAPDLRALQEDRSGDDWVSRVVSTCGTISLSNQVFSVGKYRAAEVVDVRVTDQLLEVWSGNELLKTVLRTSKGVVRKKRAETHGKC